MILAFSNEISNSIFTISVYGIFSRVSESTISLLIFFIILSSRIYFIIFYGRLIKLVSEINAISI